MYVLSVELMFKVNIHVVVSIYITSHIHVVKIAAINIKFGEI